VPDLAGVPAVRDGRFAVLDPARLEPSPELAGELLTLVRALHPTVA
jgi:hypothetical protein